jgi:hypothetical protein
MRPHWWQLRSSFSISKVGCSHWHRLAIVGAFTLVGFGRRPRSSTFAADGTLGAANKRS